MVVLKGDNKVKEIIEWLNEFQHTVNKAADNQHFQFTAEIWTNNKRLNPSDKKNIIQISAADRFTFMVMSMSWSPKGYLQFVISKKKGNQLK